MSDKPLTKFKNAYELGFMACSHLLFKHLVKDDTTECIRILNQYFNTTSSKSSKFKVLKEDLDKIEALAEGEV